MHHCHKCGWPFPKPHPSAKRRRDHKRICGTVEGYKLQDTSHTIVSDEDHSDDGDYKSPQISEHFLFSKKEKKKLEFFISRYFGLNGSSKVGFGGVSFVIYYC